MVGSRSWKKRTKKEGEESETSSNTGSWSKENPKWLLPLNKKRKTLNKKITRRICTRELEKWTKEAEIIIIERIVSANEVAINSKEQNDLEKENGTYQKIWTKTYFLYFIAFIFLIKSIDMTD